MAAYTVERTGTQRIVALAGDLTAALVPALQSTLKDELDSGARDLVFDLTQTVALDSSGIGLLIAAYNSTNKLSGSTRVVNASSDILHLLQSMRLAGRLHASGRAS
jgi:anti-anti-sigma factor